MGQLPRPDPNPFREGIFFTRHSTTLLKTCSRRREHHHLEIGIGCAAAPREGGCYASGRCRTAVAVCWMAEAAVVLGMEDQAGPSLVNAASASQNGTPLCDHLVGFSPPALFSFSIRHGVWGRNGDAASLLSRRSFTSGCLLSFAGSTALAVRGLVSSGFRPRGLWCISLLWNA